MEDSSKRVSRTLDRVAEQMRIDFEQAGETSHRGSSGSLREGRVEKFLGDYLPATVNVSGSGELISVDGNTSGQCDVLVVDVGTPPLWSEPNYRTVPIECCAAAIEVKSNLTSTELEKAWSAAKTIKTLPRSAYVENPFSLPGSQAVGPQFHVFAFKGVSLELIAEKLATLSNDTEPGRGIDSVCILDKGFITWADATKPQFGMQTMASAAAPYSAAPGKVLMFLLAFLSAQLSGWSLNPKLDLRKYVDQRIGTLTGRGVYIPAPGGASLYPVARSALGD